LVEGRYAQGEFGPDDLATIAGALPAPAVAERGDHCEAPPALSNGSGVACVEVARNLPSIVAVRDSKNPHGPVLTLRSAGWREFIADVKAGRHDLA
jgi:hypothetical protein